MNRMSSWLLGALLAVAVLTTGCNLLRQPSGSTAVPATGAGKAEQSAIWQQVEGLLPQGCQPAVPEQPSGAGAVQQTDLDGAGQNAVLVTYSSGANPPALGAALFRKQNGSWQKLWSADGSGYALSYAGFADLTGDGRPELLLGWMMGAPWSDLDIYTWSGQKLQKMSSLCYSKLEVGNFAGKGGSQGKAQLAVWQHDTGNAYLSQLKSILAKYTANQIVFFQSFSIGHNQNAAFALAGGDVWYITASGVQKLKTGIGSLEDDQRDAPVLWTVGDVKIFKCEDVPGGSSTISYAWYVKDGQPVELPYTGMDLSYTGNGQFTTMGEAFDRGFTDGLGAGHTYKLYYLYWTTDGLKEYGGLKISQQQLLKMKGAQAIIDAITKSGHTVDAIYYRANNLININYHSGDKQNGNFDNATLVYNNNAVTPELAYSGPTSSKTESFNEKNLGDFSYGGIYQSALFPKIATYPDKFPI